MVSKSSTQGAKNRGIKTAPFVVLIGADMPSVLAEIGFLTNSSEEVLLRKPEHRQKIAEALYKGIAAYADTLSRVDRAPAEISLPYFSRSTNLAAFAKCAARRNVGEWITFPSVSVNSISRSYRKRM